MSYVVYDAATTAIVRRKPFVDAVFKTEAAAKAFVTRATKKGETRELVIQDSQVYNLLVRKTVTRVNLMTGKEYEEDINTSNCCSPASEAYWSM